MQWWNNYRYSFLYDYTNLNWSSFYWVWYDYRLNWSFSFFFLPNIIPNYRVIFVIWLSFKLIFFFNIILVPVLWYWEYLIPVFLFFLEFSFLLIISQPTSIVVLKNSWLHPLHCCVSLYRMKSFLPSPMTTNYFLI